MVGVAQTPRDLVVDLVGIPDFEVMHPDLRRRMHHRLKALGFVRRVTGSTARRERRCRHPDRAATRTRTHAALERQSGSSTPEPRPGRVRRSHRSLLDRSQSRQDVRRRTPPASAQHCSRLTLHHHHERPQREPEIVSRTPVVIWARCANRRAKLRRDCVHASSIQRRRILAR